MKKYDVEVKIQNIIFFARVRADTPRLALEKAKKLTHRQMKYGKPELVEK